MWDRRHISLWATLPGNKSPLIVNVSLRWCIQAPKKDDWQRFERGLRANILKTRTDSIKLEAGNIIYFSLSAVKMISTLPFGCSAWIYFPNWHSKGHYYKSMLYFANKWKFSQQLNGHCICNVTSGYIEAVKDMWQCLQCSVNFKKEN